MIAEEISHARLHRLTRGEYHRLGELGFFERRRVELIRGIVVEMPPIGPPHANAVDVLGEGFVRALAGRAKVRVQQPLIAWDESEPEPDVALVPPGSYAEQHPDRALLVIEVAESSLEYDRDTKATLYARSGVPEYWVVDVAGREVWVHKARTDEGYARTERLPAGASLRPDAFPDITIAAADLFA